MHKLRNKKLYLLLSFCIFAFIFLFLNYSYSLAVFQSIYLTGEKTAKDVNIRYEITLKEEDLEAARLLNPSCSFSNWTLSVGYGKNDEETIGLSSQGNTNNAEVPIIRRNYTFNDIGAYDVLNTNGFDRVMLFINFLGEDCQINYPIIASPILFTELPYSYLGLDQTPTPIP